MLPVISSFSEKLTFLFNATLLIYLGTIRCPYPIILRVLHPAQVERFLVRKSAFQSLTFLKFIRTQFGKCFLLAFWASIIYDSTHFLYAWYLRSLLSTLWILLLETLSSMVSFRVDTCFLLLNRLFTFWMICFVRTRGEQPTGIDS